MLHKLKERGDLTADIWHHVRTKPQMTVLSTEADNETGVALVKFMFFTF